MKNVISVKTIIKHENAFIVLDCNVSIGQIAF